MLTDLQEPLSRGFATHSKERFEHFCHASYHTAVTGAPILDNALAFVDAHIVAEYPGGDHTIFLGQVEALGTTDQTIFANAVDKTNHHETGPEDHFQGEEASPLVYYRGQYRHLTNQYIKPSLVTSLETSDK